MVDDTAILEAGGIKPYDIWLRNDPFEKQLIVTVPVSGTHPTLGLVLQQEPHECDQLVDMVKSTPGAKLNKWRSTIRRGCLLSIDNKPIKSITDVTTAIAQARKDKRQIVHCHFATVAYQPLHPIEGSLMLYYDQLNVIVQHLQQIEQDEIKLRETQSQPEHCSQLHAKPTPPPAPNLTRTDPALTQAIDDNNIINSNDQHTLGVAPDDLGKFFTLKQLKKRWIGHSGKKRATKC